MASGMPAALPQPSAEAVASPCLPGHSQAVWVCGWALGSCASPGLCVFTRDGLRAGPGAVPGTRAAGLAWKESRRPGAPRDPRLGFVPTRLSSWQTAAQNLRWTPQGRTRLGALRPVWEAPALPLRDAGWPLTQTPSSSREPGAHVQLTSRGPVSVHRHQSP